MNYVSSYRKKIYICIIFFIYIFSSLAVDEGGGIPPSLRPLIFPALLLLACPVSLLRTSYCSILQTQTPWIWSAGLWAQLTRLSLRGARLQGSPLVPTGRLLQGTWWAAGRSGALRFSAISDENVEGLHFCNPDNLACADRIWPPEAACHDFRGGPSSCLSCGHFWSETGPGARAFWIETRQQSVTWITTWSSSQKGFRLCREGWIVRKTDRDKLISQVYWYVLVALKPNHPKRCSASPGSGHSEVTLRSSLLHLFRICLHVFIFCAYVAEVFF